MNILVTGATGFIASQIVTDLIAAGHEVTCCVLDTKLAKNLFPQVKVILCDFSKDVETNTWLTRLENIDIVINCVGIFSHPNKRIIWDIHYSTPRALFDACAKMNIKKIIQISALGIESSELDYAKSKKAADDYLLTLPISAVIVRPSLVYGKGSYGGTSLFRGLAGLPGFIPIPGTGEQQFQPIHINDLSKSILQLTDKPINENKILNAVSAKKIMLREILISMRAWLGFPNAKTILIPLWFIQFISFLGALIPRSTINTTAYKLLIQNNITDDISAKQFQQTIGFTPLNFNDGLYRQPSTTQDHWHARLYFLKPFLKTGIAFIWIWSAICSAFFYPHALSYNLLANIGINLFWQPILLYGACVLDAAMGIATLINYKLKKIYLLQILIIISYTAIISWKLPYLWLDPFAPIAKNIIIIIACLILLAMETD